MAKQTTAVATRGAFGDQIEKIESITQECNLVALDGLGRFERAFTLARGIKALRELITRDMMAEVMELQNTPLGFRTDKQGGYPAETIKECLIEAILHGVYPIANEFNVIAGRTYITREGYTRKVREFPGLTDLRLMPGVPAMRNGGAIVQYRATWKVNGTPDAIEREIPIRVNQGMGADAILGKAERKMLAAIYKQLTGSQLAPIDGEVETDEVIDVSPGKPAPKSLADVAREAKGEAEDGDLFEAGGSDEANS